MQPARNSDESTVAPTTSAAMPRAQATPSNAERRLATQQTVLIRSLCEVLNQDSLDTALLALVDELHRRFKCDRVAAAIDSGGKLTLKTLSQHANFDPKSADARQLTLAMEEACRQDAVLHFSSSNAADLATYPAHHALRGQRKDAEILTLPLCWNGEPVGAVLLQRRTDKCWSAPIVELLRQITLVAAPIIGLRASDERPLHQRLHQQCRDGLGALTNARHLTAKCIAMVTVTALALATLISAPHEIGAYAELLPEQRRVVSAPFNSYISTVHVESGDVVVEGAPLLSLDTKDLSLERENIANELLSARTEFRAAMANRDRKEMGVAQAQQQQAEAKLALIDSQIERAHIVAPTPGVITSGELKQSLGAPVQRGDVLLELAPEQGYRVVLWVDEIDVSRVHEGQTGRLSMRTSPADGLDFSVQRIHPIAYPEGGANRFRVEATLSKDPTGLRPGHTGYGKIEVGEASYLWLWTHRFTEWFSQQYWILFG